MTSSMDWPFAAVLFVGVLGLLPLILIACWRARAVEQAGFSIREEVPEDVRSAASDLLGRDRIASAHLKEAQHGSPVWLLEVESGGTDDPNLHLLLYPETEDTGGQAMLAHSGSRWVPDLIRRLESGLWARLEPAKPDLQNAVVGTGWLLYVDPGRLPPAKVVEGLARVARAVPPKAVVGVAVLRGFLGVWTAGEVRQLLVAGPRISEAFAAELHRYAVR